MYGTAKDGVIYVYNEAAGLTEIGYAKASSKANELVGNVKDFIAGLDQKEEEPEIRYAECDPEHPIKDLARNSSFNEEGAVTVGKTYLTEQFITYYLSSVLGARGYTVLNGAAYYKGNVYAGLIFSKGEVFIEEGENKICSCGFVQLISDQYTGEKITDNMVQSGLIAVSTGSQGTAVESFVVEEYASFENFSGIFNDVYFCYRQQDHYVLQVSLKENKKSNYDPKITLYDFDNEKYVYTVEDASKEVEELYANHPESFQGASTTINAIVDVEENSTGDLATVFVVNGETMDTISQKSEIGAAKVESFIKSGVKKIKLNGNQFLDFDSNGKAHILGSKSAADEERVTNGIISTIGSGLAATGAVASVVCVCQGGVIVVSAIVITTGTSAIVYNVANMLAGAQDVYYGAKGDVAEANNPVLALFKQMIPDEQTATLVYHIWGVGCTILSNVMMPVSKALSIAKVKGLNSFQTAAHVVRASVTTVAKAVATGVGAGLVSNYVAKIVAKVSGKQYMGKLAGFGAGLITGMLIYRGLDAIDQKLDISGLYPKSAVCNKFREEQYLSLKDSNRDPTKLSKGEQEDLINDLVDQATIAYGIDERPTVKIVYDSDVNSYGEYNEYNNSLEINMNASGHRDMKELINTIGHEMRHAYQNQCIQNAMSITGDSSWDYEIARTFDSSNYIRPNVDWYGYRTQACEVDANACGEEFTRYIMNAFGWAA